jgi:hypothetical protein
MKLLLVAVGLIGLLPSMAIAQMVDDPFSDYLQRSQGISTGAGNANAANEAIQTITPWPPHVGDRRIRLQGRQGVDTIERMYKTPDPFEQNGAGTQGGGAPSGAASGTSPTGSPVTPMQPISSGY